jgi:hypothetical protein
VLQLSDFHTGHRVDPQYLIRVLDEARALRPDLVVFTGDFVTWRGHELPQLARVLAHVPEARLGRFAVLGNHDFGPGWRDTAVAEAVSRVARDAGFHLLRNQRVELGGLTLAGVDDYWGPHFDLVGTMRGLDPRAATLVMCHNPDVCDLPGWGGYHGWILSGHTHGGQVRPPFLPPPFLPIRNRRYAAGRVDLNDGRTLYVSRGVGHLLPIRINVRPEAPLFTLRSA